MNLQLFGNGGDREQELRNAMLAALTETTNQLASTLYTHTWKTRTTPDGNQIISLRASQAKRSAGFSPWEKTPQASDGDGGVMEVREGSAGKYKLRDFAALASWPTPKVADGERGGHGQAAMNALSGTPRPSGAAHSHNLTDYAQLATGWPTPNAMEGGQTSWSGERKDEMLMGGMVRPSPEGPARLLANGQIVTGFSVGTTGGGQLAPALPRWLQALPAAWCVAAIAAHRKMKSAKKKPTPRPKRG